jgi:large subunit ribosomal protein L24
MNTIHVKKGDTVIVVSGNSKGTKGKVLEVSPKERKVIVEGANIVTKHVKPRRQGEAGSIVKVEGALHACKVMLYCSKCGKGVRVGHKNENGKTIRVCKKCGAEI